MAKRMYYAMDAGFTSSASIEELGETHGPDGPMVIVALLGMAKQQGAQGEAKTTRRKLADDAFIGDKDRVGHIVKHAVALGVLEAIQHDSRTIHVRFTTWMDWQRRLTDAERRALKRSRDAVNGSAPEPRRDPFKVLT